MACLSATLGEPGSIISADALLVGDWAVGQEVPSLMLNLPEALFFNLEGALHRGGDPRYRVDKVGPVLSNSNLPQTDGLKFANLANNHIMDYGPDLAKTTQKELREMGFSEGGLIDSLPQGPSLTAITVAGKKWGVICVTDPQFGVASSQTVGVSPMTPSVFPLIQKARDTFDVVCVSFHGGQEQTTIPSPNRMELFRSFIDSGAHLVWGHHPHVAQIYEQHGQGVIFYGLGNFAVSPEKWSSDHRYLWSLGINVKHVGNNLQVAPAGFQITREDQIVVRELSDKELRSHTNSLSDLFGIIQVPENHEALWSQIAMALYHDYAQSGLGWGFNLRQKSVLRLFDVLSKLKVKEPSQFLSKYRFHLLGNAAHREVVVTALEIAAGIRPGPQKNLHIPTATLIAG
jgi:hypothetical protein